MTQTNVDYYNKLFAEFTKTNNYILTKTGPAGQFNYADLTHNLQLLGELGETVEQSVKEYNEYIADLKKKQEDLKVTPLIEDKRFDEQGGVYNACTKIIMEELNNALERCPEYNIPILSEPLKVAFSNPQMIELKLADKQTSTGIKGPAMTTPYRSFKLNVEKIAGTPEDLANAIKATRESLGYGQKVVGERATNAWYNGLYRIAREGGRVVKMRKGWSKPRRDEADEARRTEMYNNILRTRLEEMGGKPAYWYLLNYGNLNVPRMSNSNKGGTGRPTNQPTRFVEKATKRIFEMLARQQVERPYISPKTMSYKNDPRYIDLTRLINLEKENSVNLKEVAKDIKILKSRFNELLKNLNSPEQMFIALEQFQTIARQLFNTKIQQNKVIERLSIEENQLVEQKLNTFVATVLSEKVVPARLYIISRDNVKLSIRTKAIAKDLQKNIEVYKKSIPTKMIERILAAMIVTTEEMQARVKREVYMRRMTTRGVKK